MIRGKLPYFSYYKGTDPKIIDEFESVIIDEFQDMFTYYSIANLHIKVSWIEMRGVLNYHSSYYQTLAKMRDMYNFSNMTKSERRTSRHVMLSMLEKRPAILNSLIRIFKKFLKECQKIDNNSKTNREDYWNIVYYGEMNGGIIL